MIGVADAPQGSNYDICRIKKSGGKWKSWEKISTSPAMYLAGDSSLIFLSQSARGSNECQRRKTKPTWWGSVNQRSWLESLPFSTAAMLEQLSQAPEHLLFSPQEAGSPWINSATTGLIWNWEQKKAVRCIQRGFGAAITDTFTTHLHITRTRWAQTDSLFGENSGWYENYFLILFRTFHKNVFMKWWYTHVLFFPSWK